MYHNDSYTHPSLIRNVGYIWYLRNAYSRMYPRWGMTYEDYEEYAKYRWWTRGEGVEAVHPLSCADEAQ